MKKMLQDMSTKYEYRKRVTRDQQGSTLLTGQRQAPCEAWNKWKKFTLEAHFLRSLMLLLVMMMVGVNTTWGETLPFTLTTDVNEKHLYLIRSFEWQQFYIVPRVTNADNGQVSTSNVPNQDMLWYMMESGEDGYYFFINNSTGSYLYVNTTNTDTNNGIRIKEYNDNAIDSEKDKYKFSVSYNSPNNSYYIQPKSGNYVNKKSGSGGYANGLKVSTWNDENSQWLFVEFTDAGLSWTAPFTLSTAESKTYYKIQNGKNTSFYISNADGRITTSSDVSNESDDMVWYFEEVPKSSGSFNGSDNYITYYYIVNAETGKYMCFDKNVTGDSQENVAALQGKTEANEQRCQFVIVQSARDNKNKDKYKSIIPKLLKSYIWNNNSIALKSNSATTPVCTTSDRDNTATNPTAHWVIEQATGYPAPCADPVISCDANGVVSMTCTESGAAIHYTIADGLTAPDDPTEADALNTTFSNPITSTKTIKAIAIRGPHLSSVVTQTIVYVPNQTFESSTYDGTDKTPVVKVGETTISSDEYTVTYEKAGVAVTEHKDAGTYTVTITDKADGDYIVYGSGTMTISPKVLSITAKPKTITYGDEPANDGVEYDSFADNEDASVLGGTLAYAYNYSQYGDVGSYTITPSGLTATNYNITFAPGTLTVDQKEVGLIWTNYDDLVYDGSAQKPTCGLTGVVNDDAVSAIVAGEQTNAGTGYTATASLTGAKAGNYKLPTLATHTFDIAKKTVTVTSGITAENKVYDGTTTATFDCSSAVVTGLLEGDNLTVTAATGTFDNKNVGENKTVTITGFTMGGTSGDNYKAADTGNQTSSTANITQLEAVLAWSNDALTYDATAQVPTATVSNAVEGDNVTVTVTGAETNVGESYTATATALSDANYKLPTEGLTHTFTIIAAALTVTADAQTKVYGDDDPTLTYTATGFQGSETIDIMKGALARTEGNNVGEYDITKGTLVAPNYTITFTSAKFTITPATLTVTADSQSKLYGALDPEFTYTVEGLKYEDTKEAVFEGTLSRAVGEEVGIYAITQGSLTAGNNYTISFTGANLIISKAKLTITAKPKTITYGDDPANDGVTYSGLADTDDESVLSGSLTYAYNTVANGTGAAYTKTSEPGSYYIIPSGLSAANYVITFAPGTLTVNPKEVGLTWSETTSFTYDGEEHAPTATATGMVNGDEIGVTVTGAQTNAQTNVEEEDYYKATASALTGDKAGNYKLPATNTQSFTITPKSLVDGTTLADGYILNFGENNTILLTDDVIGSALVLSTDYSVGEDTDPSEGYAIRTVTGINNYTGSFTVRNAFVTFSTDTERDSWSATFVAEKKDDEDIGFVLPEGFSAFIISDIRGEWAIPEPLNYIPADVPVLLVANHQTQGFVVTEASSSEVTITPEQKDKNMLEKVTEDTPGYNATTESVPFETKKIYLLYKNEFVFNKAGNLKKGKVFLNPNHIASSPEPAPARLQIAWNYTTGIELIDNSQLTIDNSVDYWYTLDGRQLQGKPTTKGLYINNGNKVVIK